MGMSIREMQRKILALMQAFHDVCEREGLRYYMLGGTMLGAVRHQGFIPWDDDADVGMPREDYDRLLSLPESVWPCPMTLSTPEKPIGWRYAFAKLIDTETTLIERWETDNRIGVYLDIFPLDGAGNTPAQAKRHMTRALWRMWQLYYAQGIGRIEGPFRKAVQWHARRQSSEEHLLRLRRIQTKHPFSAAYAANLVGAWHYREIMPSAVFGAPVLYTFEESAFYSVENPQAYLRALYGDYEKLPPMEARVSHHKQSCVDLEHSFLDSKKK